MYPFKSPVAPRIMAYVKLEALTLVQALPPPPRPLYLLVSAPPGISFIKSCYFQSNAPSYFYLSLKRLLYPITPTPLQVAPLRVRPADIADFQRYFLRDKGSRRGGGPRPKLTPEALRRLESYQFPGNILELEAVVKRAEAQVGPAAEITSDVFWFAAPVRP